MVEDFKKILIVGAGTMGHGMAQIFAQGGYEVAMFSRTQKTLDKASALITSSLDTMAEAGVLDEGQIPEIIGRIRPITSLEEAAQGVDLAIESVLEDTEEKKKIFGQLDACCPPQALLASNTSFLNIFEFLKTSRPDKILITHWYAPPQLIPLVDVVGGPQTDKANVEAVARVLRKIGKRPMVLKKFIAGYAINRLQHVMTREVNYLIDNDYVTPDQLDQGVKDCLALRMAVLGIFCRYDFGGLPTRTIHPPGYEDAPLDYQPVKLHALAKKGHLGIKTGRGFYDYKSKRETELCRERDIRLIQTLKLLDSLEAQGPIGEVPKDG
ncbi:MAG: 3-hydroxyacyl-CoA dehydrogenase family protein [Dehalococcoidia bacterium]|nr:3-hydroxyacyl-CoA dehydrogenase family protein [Dehalococcoidia bacterium]